MALTPLASTADLAGVTASEDDKQRALRVASAAVRAAAGSTISEVTGTITVPAPQGRLLSLPGPVRDVTSVLLDGVAVRDWRNVGSGLWRPHGWGCEPAPVEVTATFGYLEVPDDIVDLVVQLATSWLQHQAAGGGSTAGLASVAIDDARETYTEEAAGQVSPVFLPKITREHLANRFGGPGVSVVETL